MNAAVTRAIAFGGLAAGLLDGLDAILFYGLYGGVSPVRMFQYIAGGLIGTAASFHGGLATAILGVVLHFVIATGAAAVYVAAARLVPFLLRRPLACGPLFGIGVFLFMQYVVVPLSAVAARGAGGMAIPELADQLFSHMFLVGLPIAIIVRRVLRS